MLRTSMDSLDFVLYKAKPSSIERNLIQGGTTASRREVKAVASLRGGTGLAKKDFNETDTFREVYA